MTLNEWINKNIVGSYREKISVVKQNETIVYHGTIDELLKSNSDLLKKEVDENNSGFVIKKGYEVKLL